MRGECDVGLEAIEVCVKIKNMLRKEAIIRQRTWRRWLFKEICSFILKGNNLVILISSVVLLLSVVVLLFYRINNC